MQRNCEAERFYRGLLLLLRKKKKILQSHTVTKIGLISVGPLEPLVTLGTTIRTSMDQKKNNNTTTLLHLSSYC